MPDGEEVPPDELVANKYRLTRLLGRGGMGSVWEGVHTSLGTRVAVKFIEAEYANSAEARSRFQNEARAAATLHSKHVVQVYDHGVMEDGRPYIVMEFLAGEPLDVRLDRVGRLAPQETAQIIGQVCRALSKAHEAGIVHRDLKPENVFLVWDDEDHADIVKVVDFGIAKFTDASVGISSATRTGSLLGTPYYMSPEQARGLRSVDYRSDLWAVGVIAYRCVVGQLPYTGVAVGDLLVKICTAPLPVPSANAQGVPPAFDPWFEKALSREPEDRFSSAAELAEALAAACGLQGRSVMPSLSRPDQSGPVPAVTAGGIASGPTAYATPGLPANTAAPTVQTPLGPPRSNKVLVVGAVVGVVAVLAIAGVVVAKRSGNASAAAAAERATSGATPVTASAAPSATAPTVEPAESAAPADSTVSAPSSQPPPAAPASKPAPVAVSHVAKPRPVKPAPAPAPRPVAKPKPGPKPIDVGY